ncbi:ATP-binding cassette domain-containing protein [Streptomyces sp. HPF1205]|uniref:ATP-binding cassette domain-containing protein n=1 Tax=Streptomyces sp. HPF1205 TaxID=2873262 RepID=UPI0027DF43BC|nr:ATP-binding cassette domain-containing protein [Streptomyces sp. HPF1205]
MNNSEWLERLAGELWRRGLDGAAIGQAAAEAQSHLLESGQPAVSVFGLPETFAAQLAGGHTRGGGLAAHVPAPPPRPAAPDRLTARRVGKRYGRRWVMRGVDLTVRAGQAAAVVGANGTGKSTFLRMCAGLEACDEGQITVDGSIGFCPQYGGTLDFLHPLEHFVLVGAGRDLRRGAARRAGLELAARLEWNAGEPVQARHLSGGTRQKLNLALAGIGEPDVLLLDEPYQGFDHGSYLDFWQQVWRWRDEGKAVVVVTHLLEQLDRVDTVLDLTEETS